MIVFRRTPLAYTDVSVIGKYFINEGTIAVKHVLSILRFRGHIHSERTVRRDGEVEGRHWRRNALPETCDIAFPSFYEVTWIGIRRKSGPCPNLHGRGNVPHVDIEPFKQDRGAPGQDCKSVAVRIWIIVGTIERRPEG